MEHQDQMIKKLSSKEFLLQNSLGDSEKPAVYYLEAEFARTKKNWDLKPFLIVSGFILLLVGLTWGTVSYLEYQSRQINIDISAFEDLRLKEALNEAKEREEELRWANADLEGYHYALQTYLKEKKAAGCVIDPREKKSISIYTNQEVTSEMVVKLYRSSNIYIGKVKLIPDEKGVRAEIVGLAKKAKIKPMDWFRLP